MKNSLPAVLALLGAAISPALAVVVTTAPANTTAPGSNPFFANVAQLNGASAVYLGNGWVMTADHVASSPINVPDSVVFGGVSYTTQPGTWQQLNNPTGFGLTAKADIVLFHLATSPSLTAPTISGTPATPAEQIMMVGNGRLQENTLTTWHVTTGPGTNDDVWTEGGTPTTNSGYKTILTQQISWGTNAVTNGPVAVNTGIFDTVSFYTTFDKTGGLAQEGQVVNGDSGGAAFFFNGATWVLAGMTHAAGGLENQPTVAGVPSSTAVYGDQSFFADLSFYAPQINAIIAVPEASTVMCFGVIGGLAMLRRRR